MTIAHCLLQAGADPCIKSPHGVSAINFEGRTAAPVVALSKKHKQKLVVYIIMQSWTVDFQIYAETRFFVFEYDIILQNF